MKNMVPYGEFHIWVPKETSGTNDFNFVATAFRSNISEFYNSNRDFFKKGISSTESTRKITTLSQKELEYPSKALRFCWYDRVLEQYFKKLGIEAKIEFFSGAYAARLDRDPSKPYADRMRDGELATFTKNPLLEKVGEQDVFKPFNK